MARSDSMVRVVRLILLLFFFFPVTPSPEISTFPYTTLFRSAAKRQTSTIPIIFLNVGDPIAMGLVESLSRPTPWLWRSEEHTSELQSHSDLVCRLLLEKKKTYGMVFSITTPDTARTACVNPT